jgi:hypothetical protein
MDKFDKIWTPKKKDQSADTNTIPPQKLRHFCLTPQEKHKDQRMQMHTTLQKQLFQTPSEILVHRGGGGYIKWNGPVSSESGNMHSGVDYVYGDPQSNITNIYDFSVLV